MRAELIKESFIEQFATNKKYTSEFSYGGVRADIIMKNGKNTEIYEIKTEGDSFARLQNQLDNYREFGNYINMVIPFSKLNVTIAFLEKHNHNHVGIIAYKEHGSSIQFHIVKKAKRILLALNSEKAIMSMPRYFLYSENESFTGKIQREIVKLVSDSQLKKIWKNFISLKLVNS